MARRDRSKRRLKPPRRAAPSRGLPTAGRAWFAGLALTWLAWGIDGLLTGHLFLVPGFVHLSGVPALLGSGAVLLGAAACMAHRPAAPVGLHRYLWISAGGLLLLAFGQALGESLHLLPWSDGHVGLVSTEALMAFGPSPWLAGHLLPSRPVFLVLGFGGLLVLPFAVLLLRWMGAIPEDGEPASPAVGCLLTAGLFVPTMVGFVLLAVTEWVSSEPVVGSADGTRAHLAWVHSMVVLAVALLAAGVGLAGMQLVRWSRLP